MRVCTFCGHSKIYSPYEDIKVATRQIVSGLIQDGYDYFLVGNYGQFDRLAASVCLTLKRGYPSIGVNLVVPYYQPQLDSYEKNTAHGSMMLLSQLWKVRPISTVLSVQMSIW